MSRSSPEDEPRPLDAGLQRVMDNIARARQKGNSPAAAPPNSTPEPQPAKAQPAPARVPPGQRGQLQAANEIAKLRGDVTEAKPISYYSPELIQCTLPHSDPKSPAWARKNGNFSLVVQSGFDSDLKPIGVPYGSFPRLVLAHIITRVIATRERRIELASHFGTFLKEVGYTGNHKGRGEKGKRLHDQLNRLLRAHITFQYSEGNEEKGRARVTQMHVSPNYDLWWDFKAPEQESLFGSWIDISEDFYNAILAAPVPLRTDILKELKKSPLAIDVYMWLSYRLFSMHAAKRRELFVPLSALQMQFGTGIAEENYRQFRQELKLAFGKVAALWHHGHGPQPGNSLLQYEITETGLFLYLSPLLIGRGDRRTSQEETQGILASRSFDRDTLIKARQYSGKWSIERLQTDYFQWVSENHIEVNDPRAHFLDFVKQHAKRNP